MSPPGSAFSSPSNIFRLSGLYLFGFSVRTAVRDLVRLVDQRHAGVWLATALQGIGSIDLRFRAGVVSSSLCRWYLLVQNSGNNICRGRVLLAWQRRGRSGPSCRDRVFLRRYLLPHLICISFFQRFILFIFVFIYFTKFFPRFPFFSQKLSRSLI